MQSFSALQENKMFNVCGLVALLCLHQRMFCSAFHSSQVQVDYGQPVVLNCDGSDYKEEPGAVYWERRGEDVVILREGEPRVSEAFKDRILLPSEEQISDGNWSVVLRKTQFKDGDLYECMWEDTAISNVWLSVNEPSVQRTVIVFDGADVDLACFVKPEREPPRRLFWTRNGKLLISHDYIFSNVTNEKVGLSVKYNEEEFHLEYRANVSGKYQCWYTTGESDHANPGFPESYTVTVIEAVTEAVVGLDETSTDSWVNFATYWLEEATAAETTETPDYPEAYWELSTQLAPVTEPDETSTHIGTSQEVITLLSDDANRIEATGFSTELLPLVLEESTQLMQDDENLLSNDPTVSQQMDAFREEDPFSDNDNLDPTWNVFQLEDFPWVRTGLIGGVLLITAVVLCVLRAQRYI